MGGQDSPRISHHQKGPAYAPATLASRQERRIRRCLHPRHSDAECCICTAPANECLGASSGFTRAGGSACSGGWGWALRGGSPARGLDSITLVGTGMAAFAALVSAFSLRKATFGGSTGAAISIYLAQLHYVAQSREGGMLDRG